jgi:hypothetical protein
VLTKDFDILNVYNNSHAPAYNTQGDASGSVGSSNVRR